MSNTGLIFWTLFVFLMGWVSNEIYHQLKARHYENRQEWSAFNRLKRKMK